MGFFDGFGKKTVDRSNMHDFTDEDRAASLELRRLKAKKKKLIEEMELEEKQMELLEIKQRRRELIETMGGGSKLTMEDRIMEGLLGMAQQTAAARQQATQTTLEPMEELRDFTDEEIVDTIGNLPPHIVEMGRKMPDDVVKTYIMDKMPVTEKTALRAVQLLKK